MISNDITKRVLVWFQKYFRITGKISTSTWGTDMHSVLWMLQLDSIQISAPGAKLISLSPEFSVEMSDD
jgi:hypothetical protein